MLDPEPREPIAVLHDDHRNAGVGQNLGQRAAVYIHTPPDLTDNVLPQPTDLAPQACLPVSQRRPPRAPPRGFTAPRSGPPRSSGPRDERAPGVPFPELSVRRDGVHTVLTP